MDVSKLKSIELIEDIEKFVDAVNARDTDPMRMHTSIKIDAETGRAHVQKLAVGKRIDGVPHRDKVAEMISARGIKADEPGAPTMDEHIKRVIPYWASDERVDRHGDIVRQSWDFSTFDRNPLLLYGHEWNAPPIGNVISRAIENRSDSDYAGPALAVLALFADKETWEWADTLFRLANIGFMTSGSVGFFPGRVLDVKDDNEREKLGLGRWGVVFEENELVEWSACSVPANIGAHQRTLQTAKAAGLIRAGDIQVVRELARRDFLTGRIKDSQLRDLDASVRHLWRAVFDVKIPEMSDPSKTLLCEEIGGCGCGGGKKTVSIERNEVLEAAYKEASPIESEEVRDPPKTHHVCRVRNPDRFDDAKFKKDERDVDGKKYIAILGTINVDNDMEYVTEQAFWYPGDQWAAEDVSSRCEAANGEFQAATDVPAANTDQSVAAALQEIKDGISNLAKIIEDGFNRLSDQQSESIATTESVDDTDEDVEDNVAKSLVESLNNLQNSLS